MSTWSPLYLFIVMVTAKFFQLIQRVPWGHAIKKLECENHACKFTGVH